MMSTLSAREKVKWRSTVEWCVGVRRFGPSFMRLELTTAILTLNTGVLPHHPTAPRVCQGIRLAVQNLISNIYVTVHKSDV